MNNPFVGSRKLRMLKVELLQVKRANREAGKGGGKDALVVRLNRAGSRPVRDWRRQAVGLVKRDQVVR